MERAQWMSVLAQSQPKRLAELAQPYLDQSVKYHRKPEVGTAMVRGRMGGTGAPFNLGEVTVTRCALALESGATGHAYIQGRNTQHAIHCAILDALLQGPASSELLNAVVRPLRGEQAAREETESKKAAATQVDFFTLARGED